MSLPSYEEVQLMRVESRPFPDLELQFSNGLRFRGRAMPCDGRFILGVAHYMFPHIDSLSFAPKRIVNYPGEVESVIREILFAELDKENKARTIPYRLVDMTTERRSEVH